MLYCPPNITFSNIWLDHGISRCFLDTVTSATYALFLLCFGLGQWIMYRRYATLSESIIRSKSHLFRLQIVLSAFMPAMTTLQLCLLATIIGSRELYGYQLVYFLCNLIVWPLSIRLVMLERHYQLPTVPSNGHGIVLLLFWTMVFLAENLVFINLKSHNWWFDLTNLSDKIEFGLFVLRYISCCLLFVIGIKAPAVTIDASRFPQLSPLLDCEGGQQDSDSVGSTFRDFFSKLRRLFPYLWPCNSLLLQLNVIFCIILLLLGRVVNVFVPIFNKKIVDSLGGDGTSPKFCWGLVLIYVGLKFLSGGGVGSMGFLNNLRTFVWIKVQQYTSREVQVSLFRHLHSLSLRWHLGRKTGEVLRVMDRGTQSINSLLNYIVFSIAPTIIDLLVAIVYFTTAFNYIFGLIVFLTMSLYLVGTIWVTEWRTKYRRSMNLADNEQRSKAVDSLLNFETVKYYGAEQFEVDRYNSAIKAYQTEEWKSNGSLSLLNSVQNVIINGGFMVGSLLCAHYVAAGDLGLTVGDYVLFASYMNQLYVPLNWFGTYYRMIQQNFIDMENMFDLLEEKEEVQDDPKAEALVAAKGKIEFRDVSFYYTPEKIILRNVSFIVEPGRSLAIVGGTGEGKSTIIRLLFRFYDVTDGCILIDNEDVRNYTQETLRQNIGVVPQDTVLFNDTIRYNIKYGKFVSSDEEVEKAAKHADIHEKILNFPEKYETKVGERGLKLSGGEKQRVAIARTILKAPTFLLLDEATSALDTKTERNIQSALQEVCKGRTVVVVAHRLSTIIHCDSILVLKNGEVAEQGRHEELLALNGIYTDMWNQQLDANAGAKDDTNNAEYSLPDNS